MPPFQSQQMRALSPGFQKMGGGQGSMAWVEALLHTPFPLHPSSRIIASMLVLVFASHIQVQILLLPFLSIAMRSRNCLNALHEPSSFRSGFSSIFHHKIPPKRLGMNRQINRQFSLLCILYSSLPLFLPYLSYLTFCPILSRHTHTHSTFAPPRFDLYCLRSVSRDRDFLYMTS